MAWLKTGDTAAMDERVLDVAELPDAEPWSVNEVYGFVSRLFIQAAQQGSDYRVSMGTAMALSPRYELLLAQASRTGLLTLAVEDDRRVIRLVADGDFHHLRTREEIDWENARKADVSDLTLAIPVRVRDGDACRYCGVVVNFSDKKGGRGGTYDHLKPGQRAETIHDLVVACRSCNGGRRDAGEQRAKRFVLFPPPHENARYFSKSTIAWFTENGTIFTDLGLTIPKRSRGAKDRRPGTQTRTDASPAQGRAEATEGAGPAASPEGDDQRPAAPQTRPDTAAPHSSGEQRTGTARGATPATTGQHEVPARASESSADAAPHPSGDQRAGRSSDASDADLMPVQVAPQVVQKPNTAWGNAPSRSLLEAETDGSGYPGTGRDGTGRAGQGRHGQDRGPAGQAAPGVKRKKRGRRGRGKR
ncbi:hypothetical protein [Brachybacterium tyrofermentans]|uniref:hypothetical protein n=1 Tax=Brachybacterium tyrofermentans TaxID=47848 RepID=UPI0018673DC3|nr:hypothetical protein [Brachybacterium tyrofermentans]